MAKERKTYRKKLRTKGLIFINNEELEFTIHDVSVGGMYIALHPGKKVKYIDDVWLAMKINPIVDLQVKAMKMTAEAEIIRADIEQGIIFIALEFKSISSYADNPFYERKVYRKNLTESGHILFDGKALTFSTRNVSVNGLMIHLPKKIEEEPGFITAFDFRKLGFKGKVKIIWLEYAEDGGTLLGLEYVQMDDLTIENVPSFKKL